MDVPGRGQGKATTKSGAGDGRWGGRRSWEAEGAGGRDVDDREKEQRRRGY
jgi:hypothetical protein